MQPDKPKRLPRIERDEIVTVHEDENQHLWAVSYSDFLMALLSFFILFFSVDAPQKQKIILQLAGQFSNNGSAAGQGTGAGEATGRGPFPGSSDKRTDSPRVPASIFENLKDLNVSVDKEKESLIVNFPNDFYNPGKHDINSSKLGVIRDFLTLIKPYQGQINLYFEGHADNSPLRIHKNAIIVDNFVLSSLRASTALGVARNYGFSDKNMFIQAASSNIRNSRSLSIRIEPRGEVL